MRAAKKRAAATFSFTHQDVRRFASDRSTVSWPGGGETRSQPGVVGRRPAHRRPAPVVARVHRPAGWRMGARARVCAGVSPADPGRPDAGLRCGYSPVVRPLTSTAVGAKVLYSDVYHGRPRGDHHQIRSRPLNRERNARTCSGAGGRPACPSPSRPHAWCDAARPEAPAEQCPPVRHLSRRTAVPGELTGPIHVFQETLHEAFGSPVPRWCARLGRLCRPGSARGRRVARAVPERRQPA
jgi:hypothetical protein